MHFLLLTLLYSILSLFSVDTASSPAKAIKSITTNPEPTFFQSTDSGRTWQGVHKLPEGFLDRTVDAVESEGVLIRASQKGIMRSTDKGKHWESVISEGGVGIAVERIDGGFAAISYSRITESRRIRISMDGGKTWKAIDEGLPSSWSISSIKQMGEYLICGHPNGIFRSSDMGKTWNVVHAGIENAYKVYSKPSDTQLLPYSIRAVKIVPSRDTRKVFKIFVSGNVLYAMPNASGC